MRRVFFKKFTHPSKLELSLVDNKVSSLQNVVVDLNKKINLAKEEIEVNNALAEKAKADRIKAEKELKSSLSKGEEELFGLNKKISEANTKLGAATHDLQLMEGDVENLASEYVELGINLAKQHDKKEKELADLVERIDEKSMFYQKNIDALFNQQDHLTMQVSLRNIDLDRLIKQIEEKKVELEKIELQIQNAVDSLEKSSQFAKKADGELKEKIAQLNLAREELKEVEDNVKKAEKKVNDRKEQIASLVQREVNLEKKEAKIKAIYQKVGIDKKI